MSAETLSPTDLDSAIEEVVAAALAEDVGSGDRTSEAVIAEDATCTARLVVKEPGVVCGLRAAEAVFRALDPGVRFDAAVADGDPADEGSTLVATVRGNARAVLTAERTALNLVGRLSGIATLTRRYVDAVAGTRATILDTRKTTPGMRAVEKWAVRCGGGTNHRLGLYDGILIKDNHLALAGSVGEATRLALANAPAGIPVEVECESVADVREALAAGATRILLDNMAPAAMAEAVALAEGRATFEASGGVTLDTIAAIAASGVDFVSIGALTHSARSLDVSLEVSP